MLNDVKLDRVLFLDIETASTASSFDKLPPIFQEQWTERVKWKLKEGETVEQKFAEEAGLQAEFSRVVCVVAGKLIADSDNFKLQLTTYDDADEAEQLAKVAGLCEKLPSDVRLCSFNGADFDQPFLCRRMLVNGVKLPDCIDMSDKKPWENRLIDPMLLFKFGDRRHFCKMDLLAALLGIESSKKDLQGKDVSAVYWRGELPRIAQYCREDVRVLAQILLRMKLAPQKITEILTS